MRLKEYYLQVDGAGAEVGVADDLKGAIGAVYGLCNICFNTFFVDLSSFINKKTGWLKYQSYV